MVSYLELFQYASKLVLILKVFSPLMAWSPYTVFKTTHIIIKISLHMRAYYTKSDCYLSLRNVLVQ